MAASTIERPGDIGETTAGAAEDLRGWRLANLAGGEGGREQADSTIAPPLTLSEEDRKLLGKLAHGLGVSRTETISRALHLLKSLQDRGHGGGKQQKP
jgi:hypothetical protein